nr:unnamed protein product [Callosobruchus chinensis]
MSPRMLLKTDVKELLILSILHCQRRAVHQELLFSMILRGSWRVKVQSYMQECGCRHTESPGWWILRESIMSSDRIPAPSLRALDKAILYTPEVATVFTDV